MIWNRGAGDKGAGFMSGSVYLGGRLLCLLFSAVLSDKTVLIGKIGVRQGIRIENVRQ